MECRRPANRPTSSSSAWRTRARGRPGRAGAGAFRRASAARRQSRRSVGGPSSTPFACPSANATVCRNTSSNSCSPSRPGLDGSTTFLKWTLSETEFRRTFAGFLIRNVTLGTSLFLPSTMPKSYQPPETSVTCSVCLKSTGWLHDAAPASASGRRHAARRRPLTGMPGIVDQNTRASTFTRWRISSRLVGSA